MMLSIELRKVFSLKNVSQRKFYYNAITIIKMIFSSDFYALLQICCGNVIFVLMYVFVFVYLSI